MAAIKTIADALTALRFLLGIRLAVLGLRGGSEALAAASLTLLVAWATDVIDGPLARSSKPPKDTWLGKKDLEADLTVALGTWCYLAFSGFVSLWLAFAFVLLAAVAFWQTGVIQVAWFAQSIPYGAMIWTALRFAPPFGLILILWLAAVVVVTWPRLPKKILPEFFAGLAELWGRLRTGHS